MSVKLPDLIKKRKSVVEEKVSVLEPESPLLLPPVKLTRSQQKLEREAQEQEQAWIDELEALRKDISRIVIAKETIGRVATSSQFSYHRLERTALLNNVDTLTGSLAKMKLPQRGAKQKVPEEVQERIVKKLSEMDMAGNSVIKSTVPRKTASIVIPGMEHTHKEGNTFGGVVVDTIREFIQENNPQASMEDLEVHLSNGTLYNLQNKLAPERPTVKNGQNARRMEALTDAYNFVSHAAMLLYVYSETTGIPVSEMESMSESELKNDVRFKNTVDPRLIINIDKSTSFMGEEKTQTLAVAKGSSAALNDKNMSPTFVKPEDGIDQRRSISYSSVTNSAGYLLMHITHIHDHCFNGVSQEKKRSAKVYPLLGTTNKFLVVNGTQYCSTAQEETDMVFDIMFNFLLKMRTDNMTADALALLPLKSAQFSVTASVASATSDQQEGTEVDDSVVIEQAGPVKMKPLFVFLDGEYSQITTIMIPEGITSKAEENELRIIKLPAACSKSLQPNDVMASFRILHQALRSDQVLNMDLDRVPSPPYHDQVKRILKDYSTCQRCSPEMMRIHFLMAHNSSN